MAIKTEKTLKDLGIGRPADASAKQGKNESGAEDGVNENLDVALSPICTDQNKADAPPTKAAAAGPPAPGGGDGHEALPPGRVEESAEWEAPPPPARLGSTLRARIRELLDVLPPDEDDEDPEGDAAPRVRIRRPPTPRDLEKERRQEALEQLFRMFRRYRRNPPTAKVVETLVAAGEDRAEAQRIVEEFGAVLMASLETCRDNRQVAFVAAAMELRSRQGLRGHPRRQIGELTGQRPCVVKQALDDLCRDGIADVGSSNYSWYGDPELIHPLQVGAHQLGSFPDPIDLLWLDQQRLKALPADEFKAIAIDAALQVAENHLSRRESDILAEIDRCRELVAADELICREAEARVRRQSERIESLRSDLSGLRWQRRHPFQAEAPEDEAAS